ncbi:hypothetical protein ACFY9N_03115 [Microbacterium sp. NPDC008134]|uniref:hypothetical protein n=1 Tax=Microbacterium sp. NPDC008134 TaxID=3364183 RepID=UPI0036E86FC7
MAGQESDEIQGLRRRLAEVRRLHQEAWLGGMRVGGGLALHDAQMRLEEEARSIEARLIELGDDPST